MLGSASVLRPFNDLEHRWTFQFCLIFGCILPQLVSRSNGLFERWLDGYSQQGQCIISDAWTSVLKLCQLPSASCAWRTACMALIIVSNLLSSQFSGFPRRRHIAPMFLLSARNLFSIFEPWDIRSIHLTEDMTASIASAMVQSRVWTTTTRCFFSERELTFTFAICYRPSVCLSVVCM